MKQRAIRDSEEHLSDVGSEKVTEIASDSLLIVVRGMILAHSFPLGITSTTVAINQDMKALTPNASFSVTYLYHWFKWAAPTILGRISESTHGTKRLVMDELFSMAIPDIPRSLQETLANHFEQLDPRKSELACPPKPSRRFNETSPANS